MRPAPGAILHTVHGKLAGAMLAGMLIARTCAFALNPALDVSQYAHTAWKIRDGFAKGSIIAVAQTPDGYLWLGTAFGLYRFDGVRNVVWQPPPDQQLPSSTITKLVVARDGALWIGTWSGLASWKNGRLTQYAELAGSAIFALVEDRAGSIWVGAKGPDGKLCEIRNGSVRCGPEMGGVDRGVFGLHKDSNGNLWVGLETGVWRWSPGPPEFYAVPGLPNGRMQGMADSDDGTVLIAATGAVMRLANGRAKAVYQFPTARRGFRVLKMLRDRDGGLWVCPAGRGIVHIHQGRTDVFSESEGLSGNDIYDLFEDREGNIWVATINGLDRFHELPVVTYSRKQGLSDIPWGGMLAARDGSIWVATLNGLNRLSHGQVAVYRQHRTARGQEAVGSGLPDEGVGSLFQDSHGRIWVSTPRGVGYLDTNRFVPTSVPGGLVASFTGDASGNLWIANRELGLLRLSQDDNVFPPIPWATFGRKDPAVVLAADPLHGGLWLGFSRGGIVWFRDGQVRSSYSATDGLGKGAVNQLRFDREGALWIATDGGITRLKDGHIDTLTSKSGLPCDAVQWTIEDDAQSVWLMMPCGLVRVARSELDTWASARDKTPGTIRTTVFDNSDGLRTLAVVGDYTPRVAKSGDGKLWFMSPDGVSLVDPHQLPFNQLPPPVHIEKVAADRKEYGKTFSGDVQSSPRLPSPVRELEIDYSALSLVVPEKVLFRYKLEGWDQDWQDAGTRRQAFYSNLPPRNYTFRVKACNNSGLWNEAGTSFNFSIAPAYYQTYWFRFSCFAALVALLWALHRWRIRQLKSQEKRLRDVVETIPAMTFTALSDGSSTFVNKRWTEYTGLSVEQSSGAGWQRAIHPEDGVRHSEKWRISVATGQLFEDEARFRHAADGGYRWFLVRGVPLRGPHGKIVKWYGTLTDIEDRKRAEEALRSSEQRFRLIVDSIPGLVCTMSATGEAQLLNRQVLEYFGKSPEELKNWATSDAVHPDDLPRVISAWASSIETGHPYDIEQRCRRGDGIYRWFQVRALPLRDAEGRITGWYNLLTDIDDRKRAEDALQRSQFYISEGQRVARMGSWAFNAAGFEYWSSELFRIHGLEPSGKPPTVEEYLALVHPEDRAFMKQGITNMLADHRAFDFTKRIVRRDGEIRSVRCVGVPVTQGGIFQGFLGTGMDVTDQERLTEELRRSEGHLAEAQKLTHTASWAWSFTDGKAVHLSQEWYRIYGFDPAEGAPTLEEHSERVHPEDRANWKGITERAIAEKADYDQEFRILLPNGKVRWIQTVGHPVLSNTGDLEGFAGSSTDITELKRAEQEREKLRQIEADLAHIDRVSTLGEMAASLAHEIKQPIAAAITSANTCIEWLAHEPPNLDRARAAAARIDKYGNRAAEIIDRIRSLYKNSPPQRELVDVNGIVHEIFPLLQGEAIRYSIAIRPELAAELPKIKVDRVQLQQVFMNLMLNAIEAMKDSGGELTVKSELQDGQVQFSVSDTGVGLPMEKMDQIFSAFFTTKPQGSGMGLAISRSIVESHGGRLWATANDGRGAIFYFTLPTEVTESSP